MALFPGLPRVATRADPGVAAVSRRLCDCLVTPTRGAYGSMMITKAIVLMLVGARGVGVGAASSPEAAPPEELEKDHVFFCCQDVDEKHATGEGCITIGEKQIDQCSTVLACADNLTKKNGTVVCL
jgi:hypothetical protein